MALITRKHFLSIYMSLTLLLSQHEHQQYIINVSILSIAWQGTTVSSPFTFSYKLGSTEFSFSLINSISWMHAINISQYPNFSFYSTPSLPTLLYLINVVIAAVGRYL